MTTIAWDGKTLAADRQTSASGSVYRYANKIHEVPGGYVVCCGNVARAHSFVKWMRGGQQGEWTSDDEFGALSVIKGAVALWEGTLPIPCDIGDRLTLGSGADWAMAAMDFGKTAAEAVEYAATRDNQTGGGVDVVTPAKPRKKK